MARFAACWEPGPTPDHFVVSLKGAVESAIFAAVEASWKCSWTTAGKLRMRACGSEFPALFNQFQDGGLLPTSLREPAKEKENAFDTRS